MIIARSPLRISLGGGGTDVPSYYQEHDGFLLAAAIDRYVYVTVMRPFTQGIYLKYSEIEQVAQVANIKHPIIREVFTHFNISGVDFNSSADLPSGTGMGSSSSFTAGLINLCCSYNGHYMTQEQIANLACRIEIDVLKEPIGKQDQYAAAFGGCNFITFNKNGRVTTPTVKIFNSFAALAMT